MTQSNRRSIAANPTRAARLLLLLACCGVFSLFAAAQRYLGAIGGQVSDPSGAKIAGASVVVVETATQFTTRVITGGDGTYSMPALQPGTYITVTCPGTRADRALAVLPDHPGGRPAPLRLASASLAGLHL